MRGMAGRAGFNPKLESNICVLRLVPGFDDECFEQLCGDKSTVQVFYIGIADGFFLGEKYTIMTNMFGPSRGEFSNDGMAHAYLPRSVRHI